MSNERGFPDPLHPGKFGLSEFNSLARYNSRWTSIEGVAELVLAGRYDLLTPVFSEFIPTLHCPFKCPTCHYRVPKERMGVYQEQPIANSCPEMSLSSAKGYLDKLKEGGCQVISLTGGGEPTYHPELREIVRHAKNSCEFGISLSTNGTFAGRSFEPEETIEFGFTNVRISLDTIKDHAEFHGYDRSRTDWCQVTLSNIGRVVEAKKQANTRTRVTICIIFDERNYEELVDLGAVIAEFKGVTSVLIRPVIDHFGKEQLSERIIRTTQESVEYKIRPMLAKQGIGVFFPAYRQVSLGGAQRDYAQCRGCGLIGGVWSDGRMYICTESNGFTGFCIGDLSSQTLKEIYSSSRYRELRERVGKDCFSKCPVSCRPTTLNLIFDRIETLRAQGTDQQLEEWVRALQKLHKKPCPWIQA